MPFDNYTVGAISYELNTNLLGGKIERIYQPEKDELIICINTPPNNNNNNGGKYNLLISANSSNPVIYLTEKRSVNPQNPPGFCMLLRKYLIGGRVVDVSQIESDRIIRFAIVTSNEIGLKKLVFLFFELMGKHSNIILTSPVSETDIFDVNDEKNNDLRIIDAIKRISGELSRARQTLPSMPYILPPKGKGLSPVMAEEIALSPIIHNKEYFDKKASNCEYTPCIYYTADEEKRQIDFHVFALNVYKDLYKQDFDGVSRMLETYYEGKENAVRLTAKSSDLSSVLKAKLDKFYLKKQRLNEDILKAEKADEYKHIGDLLTANLYRVQKNATQIEVEDYLDNGKLTTIKLDSLLSPSQNAQRYYKKYNKAKTAIIEKATQLKETQENIDYLESVSMFLDRTTSPTEIDELRLELSEMGFLKARKHAKKAKQSKKSINPIEIILPSGAKVLVGHNNKENDELTMKVASQEDMWLHTKDIPGSHVILKAVNGLHNDEDIKTAASIAAYYSKSKNSENVPVDYTLVKYVKKPNGSKPGMVIFTHNKTIYATPKEFTTS